VTSGWFASLEFRGFANRFLPRKSGLAADTVAPSRTPARDLSTGLFIAVIHTFKVLRENVGGWVWIDRMKPIHALLIDGRGNVVSEAWSLTHETDATGCPTGILIWTSPTGHVYRSEPEPPQPARWPGRVAPLLCD